MSANSLYGRVKMSHVYLPDDLKPKFDNWGKIVPEVLTERMKQDGKWGIQNHPDSVYGHIFHEEAGELSKAILHQMFGVDKDNDLETEIIQTIAVLFAWLECRYRNREMIQEIPEYVIPVRD